MHQFVKPAHAPSEVPQMDRWHLQCIFSGPGTKIGSDTLRPKGDDASMRLYMIEVRGTANVVLLCSGTVSYWVQTPGIDALLLLVRGQLRRACNWRFMRCLAQHRGLPCNSIQYGFSLASTTNHKRKKMIESLDRFLFFFFFSSGRSAELNFALASMQKNLH